MENTGPQKIMLVITKSNWGGAQKYIYDLATSYKSRGLYVSVAVGGNGELSERLTKAGIFVHKLEKMENDANLISSFYALTELTALFKKERPQLVHLNSSKAGLLGGVAARYARIKTIIFTAHGWPFNEKRSAVSKILFRVIMLFTVSLADKVICVSNKTLTDLHAPSWLRRRMSVVFNGITPLPQKDSNLFWETYNTADIYGTKIISIGELHTSKGYDLALMYLKTLKDIPWTYHIIGEGAERKNIENDIRKYGLEGRVFLYGHIKEASSYLSNFDVFFLPSRTEALAYVVIEAINTSIPVIAHEVGGVPEIIKNDPGSLLLPIDKRKENLVTLAKVLRKKYSFDTSKRDALRIRFNKETMVEETLKVYR
jgi:glycosyltransferase involved in cell wall biosynthesis